MTDFRAYIERSYLAGMFNSVRVHISNPVRVQDGFSSNYSNVVKELAGPNSTIFEHVEENTEIPFQIHMNEDVAKALMLGLLEYFGEYKGDVRVLRQDYQAERKRVDRFIDYLVRDSTND